MRKQLIPLTALLLLLTNLHVMGKLNIYSITGQAGLGSCTDYVHTIFDPSETTITCIVTPRYSSDLGQNSCLADMRTAFSQVSSNDKIIIHATSMGCATVLNYLAESKNNNIKALILEAPLVSINYTIQQRFSYSQCPSLATARLSYYWLPYCAKILFPWYWPAGKQPIKSVSAISNDLPIVLIHSEKDQNVPYESTCALYYALRSQGNNNVYFIQKDGSTHINLCDDKDACVIKSILAKHALLSNTKHESTHEITIPTEYQPNYMDYKNIYEQIMQQEKNHVRIKYAFWTGSLLVAIRLLYPSIKNLYKNIV